ATPRGLVRAVNDVSFSISRGETLGIVGETGSGKSVTAFSLLRLVSKPGRISGGTIRFEGRDLLALGEREIRQVRGLDIGMILQEVMTSLDPSYTVGDQLREVIQAHGGHRGQAKSQALALLGKVRIASPETVMSRYPHQLSGGMRQRVMIAMALASTPKLL